MTTSKGGKGGESGQNSTERRRKNLSSPRLMRITERKGSARKESGGKPIRGKGGAMRPKEGKKFKRGEGSVEGETDRDVVPPPLVTSHQRGRRRHLQ